MTPIDKTTIGGEVETLPTALDIAHARSQFDETPATSAAWKNLRGDTRHAPPEILRDGRTVPAGRETVNAMVWSMGLNLFTDADRTKAHEMEAWMLASLKASEPFSLGNVSAEQHRQRDDIETKLLAGESTDGLVMESRETVSRTFLAHLHAAENARIRKTAEEICPFCKVVLEQLWSALEEHMRTLEEQDRLECKAYSLPYHASLMWQACYSIASAYNPTRRLPRAGTWARPGDILAGLMDF
jgi:hypothetical protein